MLNFTRSHGFKSVMIINDAIKVAKNLKNARNGCTVFRDVGLTERAFNFCLEFWFSCLNWNLFQVPRKSYSVYENLELFQENLE